MNAKHTSGPWTIIRESEDAIIRYSDGALASYIARIYNGTLCPEHGTVDANARLIAAAPELLAALKTIANSEELKTGTFVCDFQTLQGVARAAIAKAKGQ